MAGERPRLWLVDHLLKDGIGHHLGYNLALARAASRAGWDPRLVAHQKMAESIVEGRTLERIFRTDWRAAPPRWMTQNMRLLRGLEHLSAVRFSRDLRRLSPQVGARDILFAQMIAPRHFLAWLAWAAGLPSAPRLVLHLGYQPARFGHPSVRQALNALPPRVKKTLRLVTDSEKLTAPFEATLGLPVQYLPHIISQEFPVASDQDCPRPVSFLSLGNARREKGFAEIVQAAAALAPDRKDGAISLTIQCHHPDAESARMLAGLAGGPGLKWISHPLSDEDYAALLTRADVLLLPYHLDHYALRTSGVFCEARVAGKPVVGTAGSWLGDRIARDGGGWLVPERDPAALAACLRRIPAELSAVAEMARRLAGPARREFCPDNFISGLLGLFGEKVGAAA